MLTTTMFLLEWATVARHPRRTSASVRLRQRLGGCSLLSALDFPRFSRTFERLGRKARARRFECLDQSRRIRRSSVVKRSSC
jgi:hypothetical protein